MPRRPRRRKPPPKTTRSPGCARPWPLLSKRRLAPRNGCGEGLQGWLAALEASRARISDLEKRLREADQVRRRMHNQIQELRGNVRVFVRTRPFLPSDGDDEGVVAVASPVVYVSSDRTSVTLHAPGGGGGGSAGPIHNFSFDGVFSPSAGQDEVFAAVSGFVQSALDGYRVVLFSYGQTGSGKTHTMQGGRGEMRGIIPRAVEQILACVADLQADGWRYQLRVSFLEIYNEEIRDLLRRQQQQQQQQQQPPPKKLAIKRAADGGMEVSGLTHVDISS
ncbi:unnamed protein product, partial [Phaeothamnion confervicola]